MTLRARDGRKSTALRARDLGREFGDLDRAGRAAGTREQQLGRTLDGALLQRRIDAALEALRRVRDEPVAPTAPGDRVGPEERDFEQHVGRARIDAGVIAAHDARPAPAASRGRR